MDRIKKIFEEYRIEDADLKIAKLEKYMAAILEWNNKVNITAITNPEEFVEKHYADSLSGLMSPELILAGKIMDIGSGGGFPGIPLAITFPEKEFTLLDSSAKRMNIVAEVAAELGIDNAGTVHGRAEDFGKDPEYRESYDLCVSRAVANMSTLAEYCLPFVKVDGAFIAFKGEGAEEELKSAEKALETLGGKLDKVVGTEGTPFYSEDCKAHKIVVIKKESPTPDKYPRGNNKPSKRPL